MTKVKRDSRGVWSCRKYLGRDASGKVMQVYKGFPEAATEAEAQELADVWVANLTADGRVASARLVDLLRDYVAMLERNGVSPNSLKSYRLFTENYVTRFLKGANARDLSVVDFNRFEQALLEGGGKGGAPLSRNTVNNVHQFLRGAYNHFTRAGITEGNPLIMVEHPKQERTEAFFFDECDFVAIDSALSGALDAGADDLDGYLEALFAFASWVALNTGMRVGEVCAVRRRDLSRLQGFVHCGGNVIEEPRKEPWRRAITKGRKCRNIAATPRFFDAVDAFLALQRRICGDFGANAPIVTLDGAYMRPTEVSRAFSALRDRLGLPKDATFHSLRHTHATWCLMNGVDVKTLSERLGHADVATTLRIYAHVMPGRDHAAALAFQDAAARARGE